MMFYMAIHSMCLHHTLKRADYCLILQQIYLPNPRCYRIRRYHMLNDWIHNRHHFEQAILRHLLWSSMLHKF